MNGGKAANNESSLTMAAAALVSLVSHIWLKEVLVCQCGEGVWLGCLVPGLHGPDSGHTAFSGPAPTILWQQIKEAVDQMCPYAREAPQTSQAMLGTAQA